MRGERNMAWPEADQDGGQGGTQSPDCKAARFGLRPKLNGLHGCDPCLIVGCGIGGLVAGIACKRGGHEVTVLEQASGFQQIGAGTQLPPNATRALRSLGLLSDIEAASARPTHIALLSYRDSAISSVQDKVPFAHGHYGAPYLVVYRADRVRILVQKAVFLGIVTKLSPIVTEYNSVEPSFLTSDGTKYTSNIILSCDGERSVGRETLMGIADSPVSRGDTFFRLIVEFGRIRRDQDLKYLVESPHANAWLGPHAHAVSYPLERQELLNVVLTERHSGAELVSPRNATVDELSNPLKEWDPTVVKLLNLAETIIKWTLLQSLEVHKWTHSLGTFALLGDSTLAALPFL